MNEQIRKLVAQASAYANEQNELHGVGYAITFKAKFAELIAKECMDAVGDGPLERPAIQRIKAKFGVEYYEPIEKAFGVEE